MFLPEPVDHCLLMNAGRYVEDQNRLARHRGAVDRLQFLSQSDSSYGYLARNCCSSDGAKERAHKNCHLARRLTFVPGLTGIGVKLFALTAGA
jgi:hypothetical protein